MNFKQRLYQFMYGRNGVDQYARFLMYGGLLVYILGAFVWGLLRIIGLAMLIYAYFRVFSKKLDRRRAENAKFIQRKYKLTSAFKNWRDRRRQSKDYCFFRCPGCRAMLRVPRGKGKIMVTCRKCGNTFERKT